jgi:Fe-S-cluster containining protein
MPQPTAKIHLRVLGQIHHVAIEVPPTPASMDDLLPAVRAITNATIDAAIHHAAAAGKPLSCCKGCDACCHQLVPMTAPEARALKRIVDAMPLDLQTAIRNHFNKTLEAVWAAGILDADSPLDHPVWLVDPAKQGQARYLDIARRYFQLHRPCAFLVNGACSIYEDRPLACREYIVSSPALHCAEFDQEQIEMIEAPVKLSHAIAELTTLIEQKPAQQIPLFAALAWADTAINPEPNVDGIDLLKALAKWIDQKSNVPLQDRP